MPKKFASPQHRRTYQSWADMRNRCNNPNHARYSSYGGRGIKVCERWDSYEAFEQDMGLKPSKMTLERIDNDGDYEPGNCRWATYRAQNKNKRTTTTYTCYGRSHTIEEWAKIVDIPRTTLSQRIHHYGWDIQTALEAPLQSKVNVPDDPELAKFVPCVDDVMAAQIRKLYNGGLTNKHELARRFGVSPTTIWRIVEGLTHTG